MRPPAVLPFLLLLAATLAGCSGGGSDDGGDATPTTSATMTSTAPPPPPLPTSDTLHFLEAPTMAPAIPDASAETATPVTVGNFGGGGGGQGPNQEGAEWRHVVERPTNVTTGEVRIWIEVKEMLLQNPDTPARPSCSWSLTVEIGSDVDPIDACIQEPPGPVNPVTKELVFPLTLSSAIELEANETITVRLERAGFSLSANNAVDALSGSAEHDSLIRLTGLKEPIRPA
jgi:hypothetical protein